MTFLPGFPRLSPVETMSGDLQTYPQCRCEFLPEGDRDPSFDSQTPKCLVTPGVLCAEGGRYTSPPDGHSLESPRAPLYYRRPGTLTLKGRTEESRTFPLSHRLRCQQLSRRNLPKEIPLS